MGVHPEILVHAGRAKEAGGGICRFCLYYAGRTIILIPSSAKDARVCSSGIFSPSFGKIEMVENGQHWPLGGEGKDVVNG